MATFMADQKRLKRDSTAGCSDDKASTVVQHSHSQGVHRLIIPQASAKWRILWRMAPRLLEHWSESGRSDAINTAVSTATKEVPSLRDYSEPSGSTIEACKCLCWKDPAPSARDQTHRSLARKL